MSFMDKFTTKQKKTQTSAPQEEVSSKSNLDQVFQDVPHPDPSLISLKDLYPFGTPHYSLTASEEDASYMYKHTLTCPVCGQQFTISVLATSRLQLKKIDSDLRKHYKNLEPLWYRIWHCPHCYYAAPSEQFEEKPDTLSRADAVIKAMSVFKKADVLSYTEPRNINQVITSMYLALLWAQFGDSTYTIRAKLWLYLSWMYDDLGEKDLYLKTTEKALEYYRRMYYTSRQEFEPAAEQTCFLIIAELFIRLGDLPHAYESLVHVTTLKTGKRLYIMDAKNRLSDIREQMNESQS